MFDAYNTLGCKEMIQKSDIVVSYFGYWPEFCDGKILSFLYEAPDLLQLAISYIDADKALGAQIQFRFVGVSDVNFSELRSENVIDSLRLMEGDPNRVELEAAYGLAGSFNFQAAEVVSLLPNNSLKSDVAKPRALG